MAPSRIVPSRRTISTLPWPMPTVSSHSTGCRPLRFFLFDFCVMKDIFHTSLSFLFSWPARKCGVTTPPKSIASPGVRIRPWWPPAVWTLPLSCGAWRSRASASLSRVSVCISTITLRSSSPECREMKRLPNFLLTCAGVKETKNC